jgi:D-alanyl-D-alanine carboxypeptidase/D-alanyl-D-alanine-endopeptidase (penicillin-binding protein 4)
MTRQTIRQTLRSAVWLAAIAIAGSPAMAQPAPANAPPATGTPSLPAQISVILAPPDVARDHWGIVVTALDGTPIYALNEAQLFQPDSNAKLFTTAAALALLGPNQRFTTRVEYGQRGSAGNTVTGNVTIIGAGDGNFNDRDLPYRSPAESKSASPSPTVGELIQSSREAQEGGVSVHPPNVPLRYLADFADQIAASGVKRITGNIVGDDTVFPWEPYPQDWTVDDTVWGYGAPVSGLSINDNQILVAVHPGRTPADKPSIEWQAGIPAYYQIDATGLATGAHGSASHVEMEREPGSKVLRIYGSIAAGSEPDAEQIAIEDPAEFAAIALKELLEVRGIRVDGIAKANHRILVQSPGFLTESEQSLPKMPAAISPGLSSLLSGAVSCQDACPVILQSTSHPVAEDVMLTNKLSLNLHAELLLHHLGKSYGQPYSGGSGGVDGSIAEGVRVIRQFLINAGLDPNDFLFYDGSGLSGHDLVTPRAIAHLLSYAAHDPKTGAPQPWFADWKASLPVGGVDGTLDFRFTKPPLKGHVFAKTGTHSEGRALSGYLDCASGRTVIFSILVGNHLPGTNADRDAMDQIVAAIAAAE